MTEKHDYQESLNALEVWNESRKEHAVTVVPDDRQVLAAISALETMIRIQRDNLLIVPREPTEAMSMAGGKCEPWATPFGEIVQTPGEVVANTCYRAMIKAAEKGE